ncbi:MAG: NAD+ synthase [Candidatus Methanomethylophilaceae archaeon]|jgi:NAD+ synthase|nr:NAD+ synthase [Candidatus Methanomethylophilaceae archaeon]NCA73743.1 NAD+ synthase [Gammaproteobacteria bacterium]MDD2935825.1 NAD+ synthase [Candidatus Methanomethylophilaceae archaeon]MDD3351539.1 NAD+ synthase [Candidatus Methanomethylophilaceae archaeon]MDD3986451.1 NAD+ synthase [Candidatus Methanomethylophilaceae archaeon]
MVGRIPKVTSDDVQNLRSFIRDSVDKTGCSGIVIGLSGGIDSAVVTKLAAETIDPARILNVFMPYRVTPAADYKITKELSQAWGTEFKIVDVQPAVDALTSVLLSDVQAPLERGNISARCRMIVLYNLAKKRNYLVAGTSNQSELMTGYFTKFGDGACDMTPLASTYKTEVKQIAAMIGIPQEIIDRPPSAGFWEGQTDESEMGISYDYLDAILYDMDLDFDDDEIAEDLDISPEKVREIRSLVASMEHKRLPPLRP